MIKVTKKFEFAYAHNLPNHEGKCKNMHGHNAEVHVTVSRVGGPLKEVCPMNGMVIDFKALSQLVNELVIEKIDHTNLNFLIDIPTAENMVEYIALILQNHLPGEIVLEEVKFYETPDSFATWTPDVQMVNLLPI